MRSSPSAGTSIVRNSTTSRPGRPASLFRPSTPTPVPLLASRRWLAVLGGSASRATRIPRAAYAMFDTGRGTVAYHRVPYDIERAAQKIRTPACRRMLAARLFIGR